MIAELKASSPIHNDLAQQLAEKWGVSIHAVRAAAVRTDGVEYIRLPQSEAAELSSSASATEPSIKANAKRVVDYMILSSKTQAALAQDVRQWIGLGWMPLGGVASAAFGMSPVGGNQYLQAMVKYA
jgi:hypothetical protein